MQKFTTVIAAAALAAFIATAAAQSRATQQGASPPVPGSAVPVVQGPTVEQIRAAWSGTCRVQCPADRNDASSAVSCEPMTRNTCAQVASSRSNCRADYIPANWCASRTPQPAE